jgi:hypothetical protein
MSTFISGHSSRPRLSDSNRVRFWSTSTEELCDLTIDYRMLHEIYGMEMNENASFDRKLYHFMENEKNDQYQKFQPEMRI